MENQTKLRVVIVGPEKSGKSALIDSFFFHKIRKYYTATPGLAPIFGKLEDKGQVFPFNIWDMSGNERWLKLIAAYYVSAHIALLVFDLRHPEQLLALDKYRREIINCSHANTRFILVGTHADLKDEVKVTPEQLKAQAKIWQCGAAFSVSMRDRSTIEAVFSTVKNMLLAKSSADPELERRESQRQRTVSARELRPKVIKSARKAPDPMKEVRSLRGRLKKIAIMTAVLSAIILFILTAANLWPVIVAGAALALHMSVAVAFVLIPALFVLGCFLMSAAINVGRNAFSQPKKKQHKEIKKEVKQDTESIQRSLANAEVSKPPINVRKIKLIAQNSRRLPPDLGFKLGGSHLKIKTKEEDLVWEGESLQKDELPKIEDNLKDASVPAIAEGDLEAPTIRI